MKIRIHVVGNQLSPFHLEITSTGDEADPRKSLRPFLQVRNE